MVTLNVLDKCVHGTVSGSVCKFAFKTCGTLSRIEIEKYITAEELECCLESLPENLRNNPIVDNYIMYCGGWTVHNG